jgi:hypothetical protein
MGLTDEYWAKRMFQNPETGRMEVYRNEPGKLHICDVPKEVFYARHRNVLKLLDKYTRREVGGAIAGTYYDMVGSSRSCSGYLSRLLGGNDYMEFYCEDGLFHFYHGKGMTDKQVFRRHDELIKDFRREDAKDGDVLW